MILSNHERLKFRARIEALGDDIGSLYAVHTGLSFAADAANDEASHSRIFELKAMLAERIKGVSDEIDARRHETALKSLPKYETIEEKLSCLRRLAFTIEEAFDAGLIEDPAPFQAAA